MLPPVSKTQHLMLTTSKQLNIGRIALQTEGGYITRLFLPCEAPTAPEPQANTLAALAFEQMEEYLSGIRRRFELPLPPPQGTALQREIMQRICAIPYGHTATYGSLGPARSVGSVCACNPLPILRPCHRVLPAHQSPGNYRGGTELKRILLQLEQINGIEAPLFLQG